jgi:hypothetical protein
MTRVYRDVPNAITWLQRGDGSPLVAVPDHGDPEFRWRIPDPSTLVYDDEIGQTENDQLDAARDRLLAAVGASKIPPTAKHEVRGLIVEALGGGATPAAAQGTITR